MTFPKPIELLYVPANTHVQADIIELNDSLIDQTMEQRGGMIRRLTKNWRRLKLTATGTGQNYQLSVTVKF